eukprot:SAG31_NODE_17589_length_665_cov_1.077739_2_plen_52_part_00
MLQVDEDNEEAKRGLSEAQKGEKLSTMSEQDIRESLMVVCTAKTETETENV